VVTTSDALSPKRAEEHCVFGRLMIYGERRDCRPLHTNRRGTYLVGMPSNVPATSRPLAEILERLSPRRREEVQHRAGQGDIPFLPEDVTIEHGRLLFPGIGWVDAPGVDPAKLPRDQIETLFILLRGGRYVVEVALKTEVPLTAEHRTLRKDAAFRSKSALQKYLRNASAGAARELLSRLKRGQIPFLPENVRFERDRVFLGQHAGWLPVPGLDPQSAEVQSAWLLFVIPTAQGNMLEICSRMQ
jgi:hypothetical protein